MIKKNLVKVFRSDNFYSLTGNVGFALFSFLTFLYLIRFVKVEIYGQWVLFLTVSSLLDMFRLGLSGTAAIRHIAGTTAEKGEKYIGGSYQLGLIATIIAGALCFLFSYLVSAPLDMGYLHILKYYPILAVANLPAQQANIVLQAKMQFKKLMLIRILSGFVTLLLFLTYVSTREEATTQGIITTYILSNSIISGLVLLLRWDGISYFRRGNTESRKNILRFGKYSTASFIGSNLLRSSDTLLLSLSAAMGPQAIAIYSIPLKFVELVEIPLRSFTATAFPQLSKILASDSKRFGQVLVQYVFLTTLMLIPVVIFLTLFPGFLLQLLGGEQYAEALPTQINILLIISIYILLLPADRYSGVALFALNKPGLNFAKIMLMLGFNVVFDLIAIFIFESLFLVALATGIFTFLGLCTGWYMVGKHVSIDFNPGKLNLVFQTKLIPKWKFPLRNT